MGLIFRTLKAWVLPNLTAIKWGAEFLTAIAIVATACWLTHRVDEGAYAQEKLALANQHMTALNKAVQEKDAAEAKRDAMGLQLDDALETIRRAAAEDAHDMEVEDAKPAYTECKLPADGLLSLNRRIARSNETRHAPH